MLNRRLLLWVCTLLLVGSACLILIYYQLKQETFVSFQDRAGQGTPQIGGDFSLIDQNGVKRTSSEFKGKYQLIYFGYSFCPDICPLGLQNMSGALTAMGRDLDDVAAMFVTIDPQRDTPENLKIYSTNFHPKIIMLTGTDSEISLVLKAYKVYAAKAKPDGTMADYLMDHSTLIYVMDRHGHFLKSFPHTTPPEELSGALTSLLAAEKKRK